MHQLVSDEEVEFILSFSSKDDVILVAACASATRQSRIVFEYEDRKVGASRFERFPHQGRERRVEHDTLGSEAGGKWQQCEDEVAHD